MNEDELVFNYVYIVYDMLYSLSIQCIQGGGP